MAENAKRVPKRVLGSSAIDEILTTRESENEDDDEEYTISESESDNEVSDNSVCESESAFDHRPRARTRPGSDERPITLWKDGAFLPKLFCFDGSNSGINQDYDLTENITEIEAFKLFFDEELLQHICNETNQFYNYVLRTVVLKENSRVRQWVPVTVDELCVFLGIVMLMPLQKKRRIQDYWSRDPMINTPIFSHLMSCDRFQLILRMLHFANNDVQPAGDRLYKIKTVMKMLLNKFANVLSPHRDLCIDESIMLWKGRLSFKQYIPKKRHRFGVKLFILCDVKTGYILNFIVYTGATTLPNQIPEIGISGSVVVHLLENYLNKAHVLYTDNWYTSPALHKYLHERRTGACGTVRANRKGLPSFPGSLKKGDVFNKNKDVMLAIKWHDKRDVQMLTTVHKPGMTGTGKSDRATGEEKMKPAAIVSYNKCMGSIDQSDMQISFSECVRKTTKWYKKFFLHLLDLAVLNAYIVYKELKGGKLELSSFRLELIRQIMEASHKPRKNSKGGRPSSGDNPLRLTERHFISLVPDTASKRTGSKVCFVCSHSSKKSAKRKESRYMCNICNVGLCVVPCFEEYHTLKNF